MAAGAAWAAADLVQIDEALAWASGQAAAGGRPTFSAFTSAQAAAMDALASRILPAVDGRPGAREAGAVYFIDRALSTFNTRQKRLYANGLADLNRRAARRGKKDAAGFAALTPADQDEVIRQIEKTRFFEAARFDTIVGTFALPSWGGNRDHLGWHLLGMTHQPRFQAPFGYYDTDVNRKG
jgi:gluconate 2-dehydrogenase gamma chain